MTNLIGDARYGIRMFLKRPGLAALAVLALALGIGLTTTMFSIVYAAMLKGLPYDRSDRLVTIFRERPAQGAQFLPVTIHDYADWRVRQRTLDALAAYYVETVNVSGTEGRPIRYYGAYVSASFFDVLHVKPLRGRVFRAEDDVPSAPPVIILSYRAWQDRYRGDPDIIGRSIRANADLATVVGVMPRGVDFPGQLDAWLPLRMDPLMYRRGGGPALEGTQLTTIGRMKDGVPVTAVQAEFTTIARQLAAEHPESNEGYGAMVQLENDFVLGPQVRTFLLTMLGAVFGVLIIACANVANLLLARTAVRGREIAIRMALGAGRRRTIVQLLVETGVLAAVGAAAGLFVAWEGIDLFNASAADLDLPLWMTIRMDPIVVAFVVGLAVVSALLSGTLPAVRAVRADVAETLNDESRGSSGVRVGRISRGLVVAQLALSCGLLVAAGLMIRTIVNISEFDYGYTTRNILTARLGLFQKDYPTPQSERQFYERAERRMASLPGVRRVAYTSDLPGRGSSQMQRLSVDGVAYATDADHPRARRLVVTTGYFDVFDVKPIAGRAFNQADGPDALPVALVTERFVQRFLNGRDPLGRQIRLGDDDAPWRTVVGVVPDMHVGGIGLFEEHDEGVYLPLDQNVINFMSLLVRTEQNPEGFASAVQREINVVDPALPLYWVRSLERQYRMDSWFFRSFGTLFSVFGIAALALAVVGLYGVMSSSVAERTREIGVRMALGAEGRTILGMVLGQGGIQLAIGLGLGLAVAAGLGRAIAAALFHVQPWDPGVFVLVAVALTAAGLIACLVPAWRATRVNPVRALRYE